MKKKILALLLITAMVLTCFAGCSKKEETPADKPEATTAPAATTAPEATTAPAEKKTYTADEILNIDMFITMTGTEIDADNKVANIIAEKTGVKVKETFLVGQTASEATGMLIASNEYPDVIDSDNMIEMYEAGALLPLDEYIDKYPEFKNEWFTEQEWDKFRMDDGHIYWINPFDNNRGGKRQNDVGGEAWWIQARVLEWDNYPVIKTMDQYFDLLQRYIEANPTMEDGTPNIAYTTLTDDWMYFCIENIGQFLDGYPNDGHVIVDTDNLKVIDYNTTETTKKYLQKLNEFYKLNENGKGIEYFDKEFGTMKKAEYITKLSSGRVLGMIDQYWNFQYDIMPVFKTTGLDLKGCNYVPLGLTIEEGMENRYLEWFDVVNNGSGWAMTKDCEDPDRVFKFMVDICMDQEIHDLRFWGIEGETYLVDENGLYYRTEEMRMKIADTPYKCATLCQYSYFPQWGGTSLDGKNSNKPETQPSEYQSGLAKPLVDVLNAYGYGNFADMMDSVHYDPFPWYPMYSFSQGLTAETPGGAAYKRMDLVKHEYLPQVVMAPDFNAKYDEYMTKYNEAKPEDYIKEMQDHLDEVATQYGYK